MEETVSKKKLRDACRYARAKLPPEEKKARDEAICSLIAQSPEFRRAKKVFLYVPMAGEIDLIPLAKRCRREGKTIAFPVTEVGSDRLTFRALRQGDKLAAGAYGIPEPPANAPICMADRHTLCILPGLCYDRSGNRLGQGKGCYDRFLASFAGTAMGVVWEELLFETIPTEAHDLPVKVLVTEREILRFGEKERKFGVPAPLVRGVKRAGRKLKWQKPRLRQNRSPKRDGARWQDRSRRFWWR